METRPTVTVDDLLARGLSQRVIDELVKGSAISPEMVVRFGVIPVTDAREASKMFGRPRQDWEDGRLPAWGVPSILPFHRDPVMWRAKPARPFETRDRKGELKFAKYAQASKSGVHVFYGVLLRETSALKDAAVPLWVTEGEKKTMAAESAGLVCLGLLGVSQWHVKDERELHPELAHIVLKGRKIYLAFDRDASSNHQVRKQELELGRVLEAAGAVVRVVRLPERAPKLDDFLATHERSEIAGLIADAEKHGQLPPDVSGPSDDAWKELWSKLRIDPENERPVRDIDNIIRVLAHHPIWAGVLAFDVRKDLQMMLKPAPFSADVARAEDYPRAVRDRDATLIADWLVAQKPLGWRAAPTSTLVEQALSVVCDLNRFDEVRKYLGALTWDEVPRLDEAASVYFGAPATRYSSAVFAKWMLSAVARARTPGCQADHMLILEGEQGLTKSSALRILAGPGNFSDQLPDMGSKEASEHLLGPWIVEMGELDHMRASEVSTLKAFVTRRQDRFRHAYGRRTSAHPRRCVFAGSTNEGEYLKDATGNRRFWPLACKRIEIVALERDRDQLWAEAVFRVRAGEPWHFTDKELLRDAASEQDARRVVDPWHGLVAELVSAEHHVTIPALLKQLGVSTDRLDQRSANRVSTILRELGWERKQIRCGYAGERRWVYAKSPVSPLSPLSGECTGDTESVAMSPVSPVSPVQTHVPDSVAGGASTATTMQRVGESFIRLNSSSDSGDSGDSSAVAQDSASPLSGHGPVTAQESGDGMWSL